MPGDIGVRLLIEAEDRASGEFEKVRRGFNGINKESETTGRSLKEATQAARLLSGALVTELNPALGNVITQVAYAGRGFSQFSLAASAAGVALVAVIAGVTAYARALNDASQRQADL